PPLIASDGPAGLRTCTLSLHDALPISAVVAGQAAAACGADERRRRSDAGRAAAAAVAVGHEPRTLFQQLHVLLHVELAADLRRGDRKSTRLNSSHVKISYAVFCLKKKK